MLRVAVLREVIILWFRIQAHVQPIHAGPLGAHPRVGPRRRVCQPLRQRLPKLAPLLVLLRGRGPAEEVRHVRVRLDVLRRLRRRHERGVAPEVRERLRDRLPSETIQMLREGTRVRMDGFQVWRRQDNELEESPLGSRAADRRALPEESLKGHLAQCPRKKRAHCWRLASKPVDRILPTQLHRRSALFGRGLADLDSNMPLPGSTADDLRLKSVVANDHEGLVRLHAITSRSRQQSDNKRDEHPRGNGREHEVKARRQGSLTLRREGLPATVADTEST
mmetsp:Transcript_168501/g.541515  ORF Transcript_168501/g.541515 Transcript_168501/m.541515 type:complete len:279 (-) Transcript_168501:44-880(-)